jgi:hypothetical protein
LSRDRLGIGGRTGAYGVPRTFGRGRLAAPDSHNEAKKWNQQDRADELDGADNHLVRGYGRIASAPSAFWAGSGYLPAWLVFEPGDVGHGLIYVDLST